jgi:hypothetical protein
MASRGAICYNRDAIPDNRDAIRDNRGAIGDIRDPIRDKDGRISPQWSVDQYAGSDGSI